ncbi:MAG: tetratricopeptide repeat protein [Chitinophagales bacterium]
MKKLFTPVLIALCSTMAYAQQGTDQIQIIAEDDSIKFIMNGEVSSISNDDMADYYLAQGIEAANNGDFASAEDKFRVALLYRTNDPEILYNLALSMFYQEDYTDAIHMLDITADLEPDNEDIYNQRGLCKAMMGNYEAADLDFKIMLKYAPDFPMGNYNYGILKLTTGDMEEACSYLRKSDTLGYESAPAIIAKYCGNSMDYSE